MQFFLASDLLDKNDKLLMHISDPEETARYGKLLARSKTKQNRHSGARGGDGGHGMTVLLRFASC